MARAVLGGRCHRRRRGRPRAGGRPHGLPRARDRPRPARHARPAAARARRPGDVGAAGAAGGRGPPGLRGAEVAGGGRGDPSRRDRRPHRRRALGALPHRLYAASMRHPTVLLLVHVHVFLAGWLFTHSLVGPDPAPHRAGLPVRAAVLVLAVAAHDVLAKTLYARPPAGVDPGGAAVGAQVMYYGGAPVEIALFVLLGAEWFRRQGLTDQYRPLTGRRCPPPRPASGSPAEYWSPAPPPGSPTPRRSSRGAPTQACRMSSSCPPTASPGCGCATTTARRTPAPSPRWPWW